MPVNAKFLAARAAEHRQRLLTHLGLSEGVIITDRKNGSKTRIPLAAITERHRIELTLAQNAFLVGRPPINGDVFMFLWRLHPHFIRPDGICPNQPSERRHPTLVRRCWIVIARRRLVRLVRRCALFAAADEIVGWLNRAEQDGEIAIPAEKGPAGPRNNALPPHCYPDDLVHVLGRTYTFRPEEIIDLPVAFINQLQRSAALASRDGALMVSAPSDRLLSST